MMKANELAASRLAIRTNVDLKVMEVRDHDLTF